MPLDYTGDAPEVLNVAVGVAKNDPISRFDEPTLTTATTTPTRPSETTPGTDCSGCRSGEFAPDSDLAEVMKAGGASMQTEALVAAQAAGMNAQAFEMFVPIKYAMQWVAGRFFFVKIQVTKADFIDVKIFMPLDYTGDAPKVLNVAVGVAKDEAIKHFDDQSLAMGKQPRPGGRSKELDADDRVRKIISAGGVALKTQILLAARAGGMNAKAFDMFVPVRYATQRVAGRFLFIKVQVAVNDYIDVKIFQPLPYTGKPLELEEIVVGVARDEPISCFSDCEFVV